MTRSWRARGRRAHNAAVDELSGVSLPLALTVLLGRDADVQTLRHWLADPAARLITLTGPGGVGKTRLALEIARAIAAEGATRVVFVGLAAVRNPAFVAPAIAEALGRVGRHGARLAEARAGSRATVRPTLLVLDNFEQVLDAAPLVADLLTSVAALRVLVTSRAPLRVRGEREYAVGPLALDADVDATSPADLARALPRCGSSWSGFGTCSPTFASRPRTAPPWRRFVGGSMPCRSRSSSRRRGSKC